MTHNILNKMQEKDLHQLIHSLVLQPRETSWLEFKTNVATQHARVIVTEQADKLIFSNAGGFFSGTPDDYVYGDKTPEKYRNPWLAKAMVNLGMIDTVGYGIHTMYLEQKKRYFPLPDYSKSESDKVILEITSLSLDRL